MPKTEDQIANNKKYQINWIIAQGIINQERKQK